MPVGVTGVLLGVGVLLGIGVLLGVSVLLGVVVFVAFSPGMGYCVLPGILVG